METNLAGKREREGAVAVMWRGRGDILACNLLPPPPLLRFAHVAKTYDGNYQCGHPEI